MDWDDLRIALAIARCGSINAAAKVLSTTQPTVSRRLDALERQIGARLFEREANGLVPTPLCKALVEPLDQMAEAAQAIERRIAARNPGLEGRITVTTLAWFGDDVLAPLLARFCAQHQHVTVDLVNDPRLFNLSRREADIALRIPGSFEQEDLVERKVAEVTYGLYASVEYLNRLGHPSFSNGCAGHKIVSLVDSSVRVAHIAWLRTIASQARIVLRTNGVQSHIAAAEAGEAMAAVPRILGDRRSALIRLDVPVQPPTEPIKLGVHVDMRESPRIRALIDFLVAELKALAPELNPPVE